MIRSLSILIVLLSASINAQTVLFDEGFDASIPSTFAVVDNDGLVPALSSPNFNDGWIYYAESGDTCAASTSYYDPTGQSQDYLITPKINLGTYTKLHWWGKSVDASYPEEYVVLISTTDSLIGSFTDTLKHITEESPYWEGHTVNFEDEGFSNQDVFVAFKNISDDKFILLLDDIKVSTSESASIGEDVFTFSIFPNPATNNLNISTSESILNVTVRNILGAVVLTTTDSQLNIENLLPGAYFIEVETSKGVQTKKFIKK